MAYQLLKSCDGRKRGLLDDWEQWLRSADKLYGRFIDELETPPFAQHEVSIAGFLAIAASMNNCLAMTEYDIEKIDKFDRRKRSRGRADLWWSSGDRWYSIECKRAYYQSTSSQLENMMESAISDISCIQPYEYSYAAGLLVAYVSDEESEVNYEAFVENEMVDYACRIGPEASHGAYLYFALKEG